MDDMTIHGLSRPKLKTAALPGPARPDLTDVRLLKLAELYEMAFESFLFDVATRGVDDEDAKDRLLRILRATFGHHERVSRELVRLNGELDPHDRTGVARAAILDVRDIHEAARDFYLKSAARVHDPTVAALFRALAADKARQLDVAEEARLAVERNSGLLLDEDAWDALTLRIPRGGVPVYEGVDSLAGEEP